MDKSEISGVLLFIGAGATCGSGLKNASDNLPADSGFFDSDLVKRLLCTNKYPALNSILKSLKEKGFPIKDLSPTWNLIFLTRFYSSSEVIESKGNIFVEEARKLSKSIPTAFVGQIEHYGLQVKEYEEITKSGGKRGIYEELAGLAIWDLRVLLSDAYMLKSYTEADGYKKIWNPPISKAVAVINLNYDITFEEYLGSEQYSYVNPAENDESDSGKMRIIKPHGSLNWTSCNRWKIGEGWHARFAPWPSCTEPTPGNRLGYRQTGNPDLWDFRQQLIVTPEDYKETVVGNSTIPGLLDPILRAQWIKMMDCINRSNHLVFVGYSFPSGDNHLFYLLRKAFKEKKDMVIHASCFDCPGANCSCEHCTCRILSRLVEILGIEDSEVINKRICIHHLPRDNGADRGIGHFIPGPKGCVLNS